MADHYFAVWNVVEGSFGDFHVDVRVDLAIEKGRVDIDLLYIPA